MRIMARIVRVEMRCPHCGRFHVDREEWLHRPHHTHLCEHCYREFRRGEGHVYYAGMPPFTIRGRARALVHKAADMLEYALAAVTTKWHL